MVTFDRLQQNIMDVIAEEQIKLGYRSGTNGANWKFPMRESVSVLHLRRSARNMCMRIWLKMNF